MDKLSRLTDSSSPRSAGGRLVSDGWAQAVIFRRPKASISGKVMTKQMWIVDASLHANHSYYSGATTIPQRGFCGDQSPLNVTRFLWLMVKHALDSSSSTWNQSSVWTNVHLQTLNPSAYSPEIQKDSEFLNTLLFSMANLMAIRKHTFLLDVIFKTGSRADHGSPAGTPQPRAVAPAIWPLYLSNISAEVRSFTLTVSGG